MHPLTRHIDPSSAIRRGSVGYMLRMITILLLGAMRYTASAQSPPPALSYQTAVNDSAGNPLTNRLVQVRFTIHDGGPTGTAVYRETQTVTTNSIGIFSTVIGTGSGIIQGPLSGVQWATGNKYLQVEIDPLGGMAYTDMGTGQLMSTAYSLYSGSSLKSDADISGISYDSTGLLTLVTRRPNLVRTLAGAWPATGNAGAGTTPYIGTTDNMDLILKGHNVEGINIGTGGSLLLRGGPGGTAPVSGAGIRMMWLPGSGGAFRAGSVSGAAWDAANTGIGSIAMGRDLLVSGTAAISMGSNNIVTGTNAIAMGNGLIAKTMNVTVMGSYNDTTGSGSATAWNASDPIFVVGNGANATSRSNAIVVSKSGATTFSGLVVSKALNMESIAYTVNGNMTIDPANHSKVDLSVNTGGGYDVTIANGQKVGQIVVFEVISGSNGHRINFNDSPVYHMNLNNAATSSNNQYTMKGSDSLTLLWDGNIWVELGHSLNN